MEAPPTAARAAEPLTDQQRAVLEIERMTWAPPSWAPKTGVVSTNKRWLHSTGKGPFIYATLGITETRYAMILDGLFDNPAALAYDPVLIHRLQRQQDTRRQRRRAGQEMLQQVGRERAEKERRDHRYRAAD